MFGAGRQCVNTIITKFDQQQFQEFFFKEIQFLKPAAKVYLKKLNCVSGLS